MIEKFPIIIRAGSHDTGIVAMLQSVGMTNLVLGALTILRVYESFSVNKDLKGLL